MAFAALRMVYSVSKVIMILCCGGDGGGGVLCDVSGYDA